MEEREDRLYRTVADKLREAIDGREYFNGSVRVDEEDGAGVLTCTLIVYRERVGEPTGSFERIREIVPVWWEYASYGPQGRRPDDFSWHELQSYLLQ
ncbi:MAG: hypothetical protein IJC16_07505 [Rikenellaceae bacterium]|nr:hypothetical protein [Rikenellaceae bacterium]